MGKQDKRQSEKSHVRRRVFVAFVAKKQDPVRLPEDQKVTDGLLRLIDGNPPDSFEPFRDFFQETARLSGFQAGEWNRVLGPILSLLFAERFPGAFRPSKTAPAPVLVDEKDQKKLFYQQIVIFYNDLPGNENKGKEKDQDTSASQQSDGLSMEDKGKFIQRAVQAWVAEKAGKILDSNVSLPTYDVVLLKYELRRQEFSGIFGKLLTDNAGAEIHVLLPGIPRIAVEAVAQAFKARRLGNSVKFFSYDKTPGEPEGAYWRPEHIHQIEFVTPAVLGEELFDVGEEAPHQSETGALTAGGWTHWNQLFNLFRAVDWDPREIKYGGWAQFLSRLIALSRQDVRYPVLFQGGRLEDHEALVRWVTEQLYYLEGQWRSKGHLHAEQLKKDGSQSRGADEEPGSSGDGAHVSGRQAYRVLWYRESDWREVLSVDVEPPYEQWFVFSGSNGAGGDKGDARVQVIPLPRLSDSPKLVPFAWRTAVDLVIAAKDDKLKTTEVREEKSRFFGDVGSGQDIEKVLTDFIKDKRENIPQGVAWLVSLAEAFGERKSFKHAEAFQAWLDQQLHGLGSGGSHA